MKYLSDFLYTATHQIRRINYAALLIFVFTMDLRTNYPFWLLDKGLLGTYPSLDRHIRTDVVIIGAGISGALTAYQLCQAGIECVVVDKRHVGMGSTAATTGLLQYENDIPLPELAEKVGLRQAQTSYLLCKDAIDELAAICKGLPDAEFKACPSLKYASFKKDVSLLRQEYEMRRAIGLKVRWLDKKDIEHLYGFSKEGALLAQGAGIVNAYGLTHALLKKSIRKGLSLFDATEITHIHRATKGITLKTMDGYDIRARRLIIACGYESGAYLPKRVDTLSSTYAIVSEPLQKKPIWHAQSQIWETARPYLYLRTTSDNRIVVGGKDDGFSSGTKREQALPRKVKELEKAFRQLFPTLPFKTDFYWAGAFASTKDGFPYIGRCPSQAHTYYALGFGGNGIVFSQVAATLLKDDLMGKKNTHAGLFAFDR